MVVLEKSPTVFLVALFIRGFWLEITLEETKYFVFTGVASNTTYDPRDERINILFRDGAVKDISQVDHALIQQSLNSTIKKHYICYLR